METALWLFFFFVPCLMNVGVYGNPQNPYSTQTINNGAPRGPVGPPYGGQPIGGSPAVYPGTNANNANSDSSSTNNININSGSSSPSSLFSLF